MPTPTVEMGLGGSLFGLIRSHGMAYQYWAMNRTPAITPSFWCHYDQRAINDAGTVTNFAIAFGLNGRAYTVPGFDLVGFTLSTNGAIAAANINLPGSLPDGGNAVTLDGTNDYLSSFGSGVSWPNTSPATVEIVLTLNATPGGAVEPAIWTTGTGDFAITYKSDGRVYAYHNGSSFADAAVTTATPLHLMLTRAGSATDALAFYVNGVSAGTSTPARVTLGSALQQMGKHATNAHYVSATYEVVAHYGYALTSGDAAAHAAAVAWTNVTADTLGAVGLVAETGIRDDRPGNRVAATGTLSFAMNNLGSNSGGVTGYYSPGHASCRAGFGKGTPVRVKTGSDVQFLGRLRTISPAPGKRGNGVVRVTATDWMDRAATFLMENLQILESQTGDDVLSAILSVMPNQPNGRTLDPGSETYTLALDNTRDESVPALAEFHRLALSELGYIYLRRTGELVYENRSSRIVNAPTPTIALSDDMHGLDVAEVSSASLNRVQTTVHPRVTDASATTVLFSLENPLAIGAGETKTILGPYKAATATGITTRVGGLAMVTPAATTDYLLNALADGTGVNLTAALTVVANFGANGVRFVVTNTSVSAGFVTLLQCRGKGVYDFRTVVLRAQNDEAIASDGVNALNIDLPYQEDASLGQSFANLLLAGYGDLSGTRVQRVDVYPDVAGLPAGIDTADIGTRISVAESVTGATGEYYINGRRLECRNGTLAKISWWLTPAEPVSYWVLEVSDDLGDDTMLAA